MQPTDQFAQQRLAARRAGYSDDEINSYISQRFVPKPAAQEKPKGAGRAGGARGFLLDITPFGRVAEKVINPNAGKITGGELLTETALTALPFGLGRLAKGARGVKGAVKAFAKTDDASRVAKVTGVPPQTTEAVMQARKSLVAPDAKPGGFTVSDLFKAKPDTKLQQVGGRIRGYGRGIIAGTKPEGATEILRPAGAKRLNDTLDSIGAKGTVVQNLNKVDEVKAQAGDLINTTLQSANRRIMPEELTQLGARIEDRIAREVGGFGVSPESKKLVDTTLAQMAAASDDLVGLNTFRKQTVDDMVNWNRRASTPDPVRESVAKVIRQEVDDFITKAAPDSKKAKTLYSDLEDAESALVINAPMSLQQTARSGGGLLGKVASSAVPQKVLSGVGRVVQGTGRQLSRPIVGASVAQAGVQGIQAASQGATSSGELTPEIGQATQQAGYTMPFVSGQPTSQQSFTTPFVSQSTAAAGQEPRGSNLFSDPELLQTAYLEAISRGDTSTANALVKGYELFGGQQSTNIKKTETQRARDEASALTDTAIGMLEQGSISTGLLGANLERGKAMFSAGDQETIDFNNVISNLRATIAKARGGSSFTETEKAMLNQYTPKVGDSGQELRSKLFNLQQIYKAAQEREYGTQYTEPAAPQVPA